MRQLCSWVIVPETNIGRVYHGPEELHGMSYA